MPSPRCAASRINPSAIGRSVVASGTRSPEGARARPSARRGPGLREVEREEGSAAGVAEQDDAGEAPAQPSDRPGDVEQQPLVEGVRVVVQMSASPRP